MQDKSINNIKVRISRQETPSHCAPAVLQMLLAHYGISKTQGEIVDAASVRETITKRGMSVAQIAKAVRNLAPDKEMWVKREANLSDLVKMVREYNYPVGIDWQGIFEVEGEYPDMPEVVEEKDETKGDDGHYCVVVDVDTANNFIRLADPYGHYAEKDRMFMIAQFLERWWDDRMDYEVDGSKKYIYENRLMFVVLPKGLMFPQEMGMEII